MERHLTTRLTPEFLRHMRRAAELRREAEIRAALVQRRRARKRIEAGCWRRVERERRG